MKKGDRVYHPVYGMGTVTCDCHKLQVNYDNNRDNKVCYPKSEFELAAPKLKETSEY